MMSEHNHGQPTPPKPVDAWAFYGRDGEMRYLLADPSPVEACRRYEEASGSIANEPGTQMVRVRVVPAGCECPGHVLQARGAYEEALRRNDRLDRELAAARDLAKYWQKRAEEAEERLERVEAERSRESDAWGRGLLDGLDGVTRKFHEGEGVPEYPPDQSKSYLRGYDFGDALRRILLALPEGWKYTR